MNWILIKRNQRILAAIAVILVLVLGGIPVWLSAQEATNKAASEAYIKATKLPSKESLEALEKIVSDFPKSKVSRLAKLSIAEFHLKNSKTKEAVSVYESLLPELKPSDPLKPLALRGMLSAYELQGDKDKVKSFSEELEKMGFKMEKVPEKTPKTESKTKDKTK